MNTSNQQHRWVVRQVLLLVATCAVLLVLMFLVRAYAFTIYADPSTGEHVLVNKLSRHSFEKGNRVVFSQYNVSYIGYIEALPGDTITLKGENYVIPQRCPCYETDCRYCRYYLIKTSNGQMLVNEHHLTGKAYKLY